MFGEISESYGSAVGRILDNALDKTSSAASGTPTTVVHVFLPTFTAADGLIRQAQAMLDSVVAECDHYARIVPGAWKGGDERAFVLEVYQRLLPQIARITDGVVAYGSGFHAAVEAVHRAAAESARFVDQLQQLVDAI